jgi:predicted SprT family Zn-dependent metalloprotease
MHDAPATSVTRQDGAHASLARDPVDAASAIAELCRRWGADETPHRTTVVVDPRLRRTLGRADLRTGRIAVAPRVLADSTLLHEVIAHELAHVVAFERVGASERPHGPTWAGLMRAAGFDARVRIACALPERTTAGARPSVFVHRCAVCHATRTAKRPMSAWRCVDCSAAGLPGELEVTPRPTPR